MDTRSPIERSSASFALRGLARNPRCLRRNLKVSSHGPAITEYTYLDDEERHRGREKRAEKN